MSLKVWFAMYPGDYIRDTGSLSLVEHGAYWRLLLHCYSRHEAAIPHDRRYRVAGANGAEETAAVDCVLAEFFQRDGEHWRHRRVEKELAVATEKYKKLSVSGQRGARKRWGGHSQANGHPNSHPNGDANREAIATPIANGMANACQSQSHPQSHPSAQQQSLEGAAVTARPPATGEHYGKRTDNTSTQGHRLPADWWPDAADCTYCTGLGLNIERTADEFRDYWHAEAGQRARKVNWSLAWKRWCRRAAEGFGNGRGTRSAGGDDSLVAAAVKQAHHHPDRADETDIPPWQE